MDKPDHTGDHLAYFPCGCVATWAASDLMKRDVKERTSFYRECGKYGLRLVVVDANNPMPADWKCGKPAAECDRVKSQTKRKRRAVQ